MTRSDLMEANPGLVLQVRANKARNDALRSRAIRKMREIVKAAKSEGRVRAHVTDADIADIVAYLRDFAAMENGRFVANIMSKKLCPDNCE